MGAVSDHCAEMRSGALGSIPPLVPVCSGCNGVHVTVDPQGLAQPRVDDRPGFSVFGESCLVSGARGGPLESRNALEVFLQKAPLHMLEKLSAARLSLWTCGRSSSCLCSCASAPGTKVRPTKTPFRALVSREKFDIRWDRLFEACVEMSLV